MEEQDPIAKYIDKEPAHAAPVYAVTQKPQQPVAAKEEDPLAKFIDPESVPGAAPVARAATATAPAKRKPSYTTTPDMDVGTMMKMASQNLIPSAKKMGAGVLSSVMHPIDTASAMYDLGRGIASKIDGAAGRPQDPEEKKRAEASLNALMSEYGEKYKDMNSIMNYFAHDPAGILMDLSTILTGGELAVAKTGSLVGKTGSLVSRAGEAVSGLGAPGRAVAAGAGAAGRGVQAVGAGIQGVGKAVGTVGKNINPLNPLSVLSPSESVLPINRGGITTRSGELTPRVDALIRKTTNGALSAEHFDNVESRAIMARVLREKGLTPEAVREGILRSSAAGMEAPTSVVTGKAAPLAAQGVSNDAISGNHQRIADAARAIAGEGPANRIGAHLEDAYVNSYNNHRDLYNNIAQTEGAFTTLGGGGLESKLSQKLSTSGLPPTAELMSRATNLPQASKAISILDSVINKGMTRTNAAGSLTAQEINALRTELNDLRSSASGRDIKAVGDIIDAFDDHVEDMAAQGKFKNLSGAANTSIAQDLADARDAYKKHMRTFETPNGQNNNIVAAVQKMKKPLLELKDDATGKLTSSGSDEVHQFAESGLLKDLTHPTKGPITHSQLSAILPQDAMDSVNAHVRAAAAPTKNGRLVTNQAVMDAINSPTSSVARAFANDPEALNALRRLHAANLVNSGPVSGKTAQTLRGVMGPAAARAGTQFIAGHLYGLPGYIAGSALEHGAEAISNIRKSRAALAGAPAKSGIVRKALNVARGLTAPGTINVARATRPEAPADQSTPATGVRSVRNNNMGNIKDSEWARKQPGYVGSDGTFAVFDSPESGKAAADKLLQNKGTQGLNTPRKIIQSWAPDAPPAYSEMVAKAVGVGPDDRIDLSNPAVRERVLAAIRRFEGDTRAASGGRIERAAGGAVGKHEKLVNRLMVLAKKAKKGEEQATQALLAQPDEAVVKALSVAQEAI